MKQPTIPTYRLYGGRDAWQTPDLMHCETLRERSKLNNWDIKPHRHDELHQILFITKGVVTVSIDGVNAKYTAPLILYFAPMTIHGLVYEPDAEGHVIMLHDSMLKADLPEITVFVEQCQPAKTIASVEIGDNLVSITILFETLYEEFCGHEVGRNLTLYACLTQILMHIFRLSSPNMDRKTHSETTRGQLAIKFKGLIDSHYRIHSSVAHYAKTLGVSKSKLISVSKEVYGCPPQDVIHSRIILEAKRSIIYTSMTIAEIAYDLGFKDTAYFSRFYKRRTGQNPSDYRNMR